MQIFNIKEARKKRENLFSPVKRFSFAFIKTLAREDENCILRYFPYDNAYGSEFIQIFAAFFYTKRINGFGYQCQLCFVNEFILKLRWKHGKRILNKTKLSINWCEVFLRFFLLKKKIQIVQLAWQMRRNIRAESSNLSSNMKASFVWRICFEVKLKVFEENSC